jgi:hypothetical protein
MADNEGDEELRSFIRKMIREEAGDIAKVSGGSRNRGDRSDNNGGGGVDLGELGKFVSAAKGMKEAMTSDVDKALSTAVSNKIVDQVIPSMSPQPRASAGFLDSGFAIAFAQKLPEQLASLVDVFFNKLGPDRAGKLVDGIQQKFLGGGGGSSSGGGGTPTEDDILSSLDSDNPAHLHQYMAYKKLNDPDIAKRTLIAEQDIIRKRTYSNTAGGNTEGGGYSVGGGSTNAGLVQILESQNTTLKELIAAKTEDRKVMEALYNEINKLKHDKHGRINEDIAKDFDIEDVKSGKHADNLGIPEKEKSVEEEAGSDELVSAVKLEDVVIKKVTAKVGSVEAVSGNTEGGNGNTEDGNGNTEGGNGNTEVIKPEENKKTTVVMKKGGSKPKFE